MHLWARARSDPAGHTRALKKVPRFVHGADVTLAGVLTPVLSKQRISRLIDAVGEELTGDWVLVGGALAALWFSPERVTEDVDLIALAEHPDRRHELMDFALTHGLPLESVNSAADFFLRRIQGWTQDIEILHAGSQGRVFRPTATLFLLLKCGRMSEADLDDCLALLDLARATQISLDRARVLAYLGSLPEPESLGALSRRERLRSALAG